jgi:peptide/nickel transport system substrate-binding protein
MKPPARFVAVLLALGLAAGCVEPQESGASGASVSIVLYQEPTEFSPLAPALGANQQVMSMIYQSLMVVDPDLRLVPRLAAEVDVAPDATSFTFHLREGLKWSDGKPFTSADVLFTHQLLADPKSTSAVAGYYRGVVSMTAPDADTFVITTGTPNYGILAQVGVMPILPKHVLGDKPVDRVAGDPFFANPTVGLGPFQFVGYHTGRYVELKANPHFPVRPGIDRVYLRPLTAAVATARLRTGEVDVAPIAPTDRSALESVNSLSFKTSGDGGFVRIGVNHTQARFADVRVRQALLYGIDRKSIVDRMLPGVGRVRDSSFDPSVSGGGIEKYGYDPDKARRLLTEAGWDRSRSVRLSWIPGSNPDRDAAALAVRDQLAKIGVDVELTRLDTSGVTDMLKNADFDLYLFGGGDYAVDSWNVNAIEGCDTFYPNGGNIVKFCDPALDAKMKQANGTTDENTRLALYREAAAIDNEQVPYLWLYTAGGLWAVNKRVENFQPLNPTGGGFWQPEKWRLS